MLGTGDDDWESPEPFIGDGVVAEIVRAETSSCGATHSLLQSQKAWADWFHNRRSQIQTFFKTSMDDSYYIILRNESDGAMPFCLTKY
ncbi:hypothetical protein RHGRI_027524 [Rhododendron griersonianum]|uniref:Uncharacterized protein n=1 Tax=Rhododendron griersonianum TaxID=479676 RepID=A0AAV6IXS3_9ERIC|nr:hypothetical protein RHGRI_027524 [Rhododendron griersonianum]